MKFKQWLTERLLINRVDEKLIREKEVSLEEMQAYCIEAIEGLESKLEFYRDLFENNGISLRPELVEHKNRKGEFLYYWTIYFLWDNEYITYGHGVYVVVRFRLAWCDKWKKKSKVTINYQDVFDSFIKEQLKNALEEAKDKKIMEKHVKRTALPPEEEGHVMINW